jgi:hypothetical protein
MAGNRRGQPDIESAKLMTVETSHVRHQVEHRSGRRAPTHQRRQIRLMPDLFAERDREP